MSQGVHGVDARLQYILQNTSVDSTVLSMTDNLYIRRHIFCYTLIFYKRTLNHIIKKLPKNKNLTYIPCNIRPR